MSCGIGHRHGLDPTLLWLWRRPAATTLIRPLAWEPPYAAGAAQEMAKKKRETQGAELPDGGQSLDIRTWKRRGLTGDR